MFRIEVFVDDKKLSGFLHACAGLVASMSPPMPVVNVREKGLEAVTNGTLPAMFYAELKKKEMMEFTPEAAKKILKDLGSEESYSYICKKLKEHKQAKLMKRGLWRVL
jgi:hypothetical protein